MKTIKHYSIIILDDNNQDTLDFKVKDSLRQITAKKKSSHKSFLLKNNKFKGRSLDEVSKVDFDENSRGLKKSQTAKNSMENLIQKKLDMDKVKIVNKMNIDIRTIPKKSIFYFMLQRITYEKFSNLKDN